MVRLTTQVGLLLADLTTMIIHSSHEGTGFVWGILLFWILSAFLLARQVAGSLFIPESSTK